MSKSLFIAEKPSVAREFAATLKEQMNKRDGYMESDSYVVTWCVGHLVTMSYPEVYDEKYKKWRFDTLPFLPQEFKYEIIPSAAKQFKIVSGLLNRKDVETIYVCTDSGREGEYIYRLVDQMANVKGKAKKRVWIDSQTEEEILKGIREAKDLSAYDNLSASAYLRAKEDYLMGINFSRVLTLKYGNTMANLLGQKWCVVSVGRVMTCVLGMVVRREREIREFVKTPFYRVLSNLDADGYTIEAEWKAVEGSEYFESPKLYKENGFKQKEDAGELVEKCKAVDPQKAVVTSIERKKEKKNPPLLYNLAELQNDCSRMFKISPDETLKVVQELYEKKLVTYPRTDARVLSTAVSKEITKNLNGLLNINAVKAYADYILQNGLYKGLDKTRYVNDKMITDHYAIIPTGQGIGAMKTLKPIALKVYETIVRRFLAIFLPPAVYTKVNLAVKIGNESFFASFKVLDNPGYMKVMSYSFNRKPKEQTDNGSANGDSGEEADSGNSEEKLSDREILEKLALIKKGMTLDIKGYDIKEGETSPPKRYNSGSIILAMENAGQLIEDEELRAQIKGSGIGTSATRAEILKKLVNNKYLAQNSKTQIITPTLLGELIFDVVGASIKSLLNPELTASWEKGLTYVYEGSVTSEEYMKKLEAFIQSRTDGVKGLNNTDLIRAMFDKVKPFYRTRRK